MDPASEFFIVVNPKTSVLGRLTAATLVSSVTCPITSENLPGGFGADKNTSVGSSLSATVSLGELRESGVGTATAVSEIEATPSAVRGERRQTNFDRGRESQNDAHCRFFCQVVDGLARFKE